ncbi:hypothetical protein M9Y10_037789 [Tritrichomonas musculus]|uniref:ABC transporter domain-containing protein n=1 Tax=Tritrichomonas musculus TaxID=1915356 RepID=A0ABR2GRK3_9EUKA
MQNDINIRKDDDNPLGSWEDLRPTFSNQVKALLKKNFLIRIRNISSIIEIICAFIIPLILLLDYYLGETKFPEMKSPQINKVDFNSLLEWFLAFGPQTKVACLPDKPLMRYLIGNTTFLNILINGGTIPVNGTTTTLPGTQISYVNTLNELKDIVYSTQLNNIGFEWTNIDSSDALINPTIKVYFQSVFGSPQASIYLQIRDSLVTLRSISEGVPPDIQNMKYMKVNFYKSDFSRPKIVQRMVKLAFPFGLMTPISTILCTLPDMELIFSEKDSHVTALSYLMGMSELAYWFTNFIVSFVICLVVHLFISVVYCFWFGLNGNDFGMVFVLSVLYVIAEIWFQFFITALIKDASKGKSLTIIMIMVTIILSMFFQFVTLNERTTLTLTLNHIFCLFPISTYEIFLIQGFIQTVAELPLYRWNDMNNKAFMCPPWIPLMWSAIDIVLYFFLFLICNAYCPRAFGINNVQLFKKKNKNASSIRDGNTSDLSIDSNQPAIDVNNLTKVYHGTRKVTALNSVSFDISKGEVIVMIGPNGAGKSTMINCLSGGIKPTEGIITILGENKVHSVGVCYQTNVLIPQLSVEEHFELFGAFRGISKETLQTSIEYLATNMQLTHMLKNRAGDLSGGQKRKLCIGLSLLGNPEVVLMDEPTAGVDVQACQLIWKMISGLKNTTSLITSHALEEAEAVSSRLFILSEGILRFIGTSTELREQFKCGYELRVETSNNDVQSVLDFVRKYIPDAKVADDRKDVILMPVCLSIGKLLQEFEERQNELGVISYSFAVQQLEDMLLKSLEN